MKHFVTHLGKIFWHIRLPVPIIEIRPEFDKFFTNFPLF